MPTADSLSTDARVRDAIATQSIIKARAAVAHSQIPPYNLDELIGQGTFGKLYRASRIKTEKVIAVKVICLAKHIGKSSGKTNTAEELRREIHKLRNIRKVIKKHNSQDGDESEEEEEDLHVNAILDTYLVDESIWIISDFCSGGSVATLMKPTGTGLPERWIVPIMRETAEALSWVHEQGVVHRDIKAANVLIEEKGNVKLCDFGIADIMEKKCDKDAITSGTRQWMAPEMFRPNTTHGPEIDIWAFGCLVYEVATGRPPRAFNEVSVSDFASSLRSSVIKNNCPRLVGQQYSYDLKDLVEVCLVEDPKERPSIQQVKNHGYLYDTESFYPASDLELLVEEYQLWEKRGSARMSQHSTPDSDRHMSYRYWDDEYSEDLVFDSSASVTSVDSGGSPDPSTHGSAEFDKNERRDFRRNAVKLNLPPLELANALYSPGKPSPTAASKPNTALLSAFDIPQHNMKRVSHVSNVTVYLPGPPESLPATPSDDEYAGGLDILDLYGSNEDMDGECDRMIQWVSEQSPYRDGWEDGGMF